MRLLSVHLQGYPCGILELPELDGVIYLGPEVVWDSREVEVGSRVAYSLVVPGMLAQGSEALAGIYYLALALAVEAQAAG